MSEPKGKLILCPTPLGNLEDITLRTLRALRECDVIFAEDTRVSNKLLHHYDIRKPLRSFHERVETARIAELRALLAEGKAVAVVTDAGMPGISDPGSELVRAARESNAAIEVLPGPSVALAALVLSGFDVARFRFDGFPPRKSAERRRYLGGLQHEESPVVWFESARRVGELLRDVAAMLPQRRLFVLREYTKLFEQHLAGSAAELLRELKEQRGEFTIVLEGCERGQAPQVDVARINDAVALLRDAGLGARTISEVLRLATGLPKNELYRLAARKLRG
ncbi:MAG TPA: 16S rRNA (cytidine(1402)-2'-O)-methyltransferase [Candidatus Eremiobacteraceae bacterium]|nr:16S rRNA (cytidine(1402)-2'-O)-methyltransferase [Candidatus Eremiobacteraceae bacterium]